MNQCPCKRTTTSANELNKYYVLKQLEQVYHFSIIFSTLHAKNAQCVN